MAITMSRFARITAAVGGIGHAPAMPGTWGSAVALPLAWGLHSLGGIPLLAIATLVVFVLGVWVCEIVTRESATKDPGWIVIDEVVGMWLVLLVVPPDIDLYAIGFVLFRIADIWKPWPASWADRVLTGGTGIMVDDVFAAAWAPLVLNLFRYAWYL